MLLLRLTVPLLRDGGVLLRFTVPLLRVLELRLTVPLLRDGGVLLRFTVPLLRVVVLPLLTVPLLLRVGVVLRVTVPLLRVDVVLRVTVPVDRVVAVPASRRTEEGAVLVLRVTPVLRSTVVAPERVTLCGLVPLRTAVERASSRVSAEARVAVAATGCLVIRVRAGWPVTL